MVKLRPLRAGACPLPGSWPAWNDYKTVACRCYKSSCHWPGGQDTHTAPLASYVALISWNLSAAYGFSPGRWDLTLYLLLRGVWKVLSRPLEML